MICPKCKQDTAFPSSTYPEDLVCYCGTSKLEVVGSTQEVQEIKIDNLEKDFSNYKMKELLEEKDIRDIGYLFKNGLASSYFRNTYLNNVKLYLYYLKDDYDYNLLLWVNSKNELINVEYQNQSDVPLKVFNHLKTLF